MLAAATLNTCTSAYRKGYYDGYYRRDPNNPGNKFPTTDYEFDDQSAFGEWDYSEGYRAGDNDHYWDEYYAKNGYGKR